MSPKTQSGNSGLPNEPGVRTDARLGRMVRLLKNHSAFAIASSKIADELGITPSEVSAVVHQLRELGVGISGDSSAGYRLDQAPDLLLPEVLESLISDTIFAGNIHHYFRVSSTNTAAMQAASRGEPEGAVFVAEEQTAGRGRGNHQWESTSSAGIYCSAILRPNLSPADILLMSLATGLAVCDAVREVTGLKAELRWPNDVLYDDRKFCGILIELHAEASRVHYVVAGIGLNVNQQEFPEELRSVATSLRLETGREWSRLDLTAALLKSLDHEYRAFVADSALARGEVRRRFEQNSSYVRGRSVHVDEDGGYDGTTAGLDERGFLLVQTEAGLRTVLSGGVRPR